MYRSCICRKETNLKKIRDKKSLAFIESVVLIIIILIIWHILSELGYINRVLLPAPKAIVQTFINKITDGSLIAELWISILRVLQGYACAIILGVGLGIWIGLSDRMYNLTKVLIQILRPIPPIAWIPLVILWMGIGEGSKVFLIFLGGFFVILINVIDGIRYIDPKLIEVAKAVETPRMKYVTQLVIPAAMPTIFTGFKVALGTCWSCVVAAELVAASSGIGYMISNARNFGQMDVVIIGMVSIGIVGKIMDEILKMIEKRVLKWT